MAEARLEAVIAQDAQHVLGDAPRRLADKPHAMRRKIGQPADGIVHGAIGVEIERVDREIAPRRVFAPIGIKRDTACRPSVSTSRRKVVISKCRADPGDVTTAVTVPCAIPVGTALMPAFSNAAMIPSGRAGVARSISALGRPSSASRTHPPTNRASMQAACSASSRSRVAGSCNQGGAIRVTRPPLQPCGCHRPNAAAPDAGVSGTSGRRVRNCARSGGHGGASPSPLDLPRVYFRQSASEEIAAIPLEPAARVIRVNPPLFPPHRQILAGIDPEIIQRAVAPARCQLRVDETIRRGIRRGNRSCTCRRTRRAAASRPGSVGAELRIEISRRSARPAHTSSRAASCH